MPRTYVRRFNHEEAKRRYAAGESVAAMAREYEVSDSAIWQVVSPKTRASVLRVHARIAASGKCDDCGGPMNGLSRYSGSVRCKRCSRLALATSVREDTLRCIDCGEWKPDEDFSMGRSKGKNISRRGRHRQCRPCQTIARRDHRRRNREADNTYQREYRRRRRWEQMTPLQRATTKFPQKTEEAP